MKNNGAMINSMSKYFYRVDDLPVFENLEDELNELLESEMISWTGNQICINTIENHLDEYTIGCGSLHYNWNNVVYNNKEVEHIPLKENKIVDEDFRYLCRPFIGTLFEDLYNTLNTKYHLGRLRIMKSEPFKCMSWHRDISNRIHYPIKTSNGCRMVIEEESFHIPQNEWWMTKTEYFHTAFNGSREERIHVVGVIL